MFYAIIKTDTEIKTKYFDTEERLKCFIAFIKAFSKTMTKSWDIIESGKI